MGQSWAKRPLFWGHLTLSWGRFRCSCGSSSPGWGLQAAVFHPALPPRAGVPLASVRPPPFYCADSNTPESDHVTSSLIKHSTARYPPLWPSHLPRVQALGCSRPEASGQLQGAVTPGRFEGLRGLLPPAGRLVSQGSLVSLADVFIAENGYSLDLLSVKCVLSSLHSDPLPSTPQLPGQAQPCCTRRADGYFPQHDGHHAERRRELM